MDTLVKTVPAIRSTQGCWTCRLRRKKCDEARPGCLRCDSVNVTCCYGPKPKWMESSSRAKEELERIKIIVGASASRKRAAFRSKSAATESESPHPLAITPVCRAHDQTLPAISSLLSFQPGGLAPKEESEIRAFPYSKWAEDHEASLMMHYLDNVFFIQFRFHTPSISTGGRGWLLSLLTRTKPLYHAALSLSAFHQQSVLCLGHEGSSTQGNTLQDLERHHNLTLQELQLFIHAHSENENTRGIFGGSIQILACMVQLISFELFNGGTSNWQVHLRAASTLILTLHGISGEIKHGIHAFQREPRSSSYSPSHDRPSPNGPISSEHAALNFLTGAIIWFDILACVSTNFEPYLSDHHLDLLSVQVNSPYYEYLPGGKIELHTIMGCQNWAMMIISEIAQLGEQKDSRKLHAEQLKDNIADIRHRLGAHTSRVREELDTLRAHYRGPPPSSSPEVYNKYTVYVVTYVFARAAFLYLHNADASPPPQHMIQDAIASLRMIPDPRMARGLIWPICVAGSMAETPSDQDFFRELTTGAVNDSGTFGNSGKALDILQKAWEMQREQHRPIDCSTAIRHMGSCVLLV